MNIFGWFQDLLRFLRGHNEAPSDDLPPWLEEMRKYLGKHEVKDNAELVEFLRSGKYLGDPAKLPWCGDGLESCFVRALPDEPLPKNPFFAQNWKDFGYSCMPVVGSIGVIRWKANAGHVGIVVRVTRNNSGEITAVHLLGANQSNAVKVSVFPASVFIAFRWPSTYPYVPDFPPLGVNGQLLTLETTR